MPYIHVTLASEAVQNSRSARSSTALTDNMERVLEVARLDIHVLLWELPTENLGEGGEEPSPETTNTVAVLACPRKEGRPRSSWC